MIMIIYIDNDIDLPPLPRLNAWPHDYYAIIQRLYPRYDYIYPPFNDQTLYRHYVAIHNRRNAVNAQ